MTDMNDSETEVQAAGHQAFESGTRLIRLLNDFMGAVQINEDRVAEHINQSCATITEVADSIARMEGISFKEAHEVAAKMAKIVVEEGGSLDTFDHEQFKSIYQQSIGSQSKIDADTLKEIASPGHFISVRKITGGPAIPAFEKSLKKYTAAAIHQSNENVSFFERIMTAREDLANAVKAVTEGK